MEARMGTVHQNAALETFAAGYKNSEFVLGEKVFRKIPVKFQSDNYYIYDKGARFRNEVRKVGPRGKVPRIGFTYSTGIYIADDKEIAVEIPEKIRRNADAPILSDLNGTQIVMDQLLLDMEITVATALVTTANWTNTVALTATQWDSAGGGDPIANFRTGKLAVRASIGITANTAVLTYRAADALMNHADFLARIQYTGSPAQPQVVTPGVIAQVLGLENIVIVGGMYDSANEGQTSTLADIMTDTVWVGYVSQAEAPSLMNPSAGYIFVYQTPRVKSWSENDPEQEVVKAEWGYTVKATMAGAGYTMTDVLAAI